MDHFQYRDGQLCAEAVPLARIAEAVGTPFYCYSTATLERHYRVFAEAVADLPATICFAVKANPNIAVIRTLARLGAGADVVSGGEMMKALEAGVPAERIVFSGVGKTRDEMALALKTGIMQINVESEPELAVLDSVARELGVIAPIAVRVNPDVDAKTHRKITTGKSENKFGIDWTFAREFHARAAAFTGLRIVGLSVHIGSQLRKIEPFRDAFARVREMVLTLREDGHAIESIDFGGGLGIPYGDDADDMTSPGPQDYAAVVKAATSDLGCRLIFEPGRVIVGNAGVLVTRVLYVKHGPTRRFAIVDAAMNDLIRPALYDAYHDIVPVSEPSTGTAIVETDVVGPVCETGDTFGVKRPLPEAEADDLLAIRSAGAYAASMSSTYNSRPLIPEVLVKDDAFAVVRPRLSVEEMIAGEAYPDWLD
ncbi:MAG: diaminopimelate decarboxylase [Rhodospirillales bacterium]|jgi:diaminopimelate decarboxylase|nr:diaminopimelate decarboxylase [Rhodospirillales bacterium]